MIMYCIWTGLFYVISFLFSCIIIVSASTNCKCNFGTGYRQEDVKKLEPLCGLRFSHKDAKDGYSYVVGICTSAFIENPKNSTAVIQKSQDNSVVILGDYLNETRLMTGSGNWIYLEYSGGQSYNTHCDKEDRRAIIMITCSQGISGSLNFLEENRDRTHMCYYLFELSHQAVCSDAPWPPQSGLSVGTIICIIVAVVVGLYLIIGLVYKRFFVGAQGWEQLPNYSFWKEWGNLQADGCSFICRCGSSYSDVDYGDHTEGQGSYSDRDDRLLSM